MLVKYAMKARRSVDVSRFIVGMGWRQQETVEQSRPAREVVRVKYRQTGQATNLLGMPLVPFSALTDSARFWVFGSDVPIVGAPADSLLAEVDQYLDQWKAHGFPLKAAREWKENRFLIVGIDPTEEQASGCSIDGLFRQLQQIQRTIGAQLVGGGRVFYRDDAGTTQVTTREEFSALKSNGAIG